MGSERKSKKVEEEKERSSRNKRRHSPSDSGDGRKSKKKHRIHEYRGERRIKKSRRKEKDKRKDTKSHDRSKRKEKKTDEKHESKHHRDQLKLNIQELSADDYFSKHNEFAMWLKEEKNVYFNELSSDSTHQLFGDFVNTWNDHKLDLQYYEGIQTAPRTAHNWNIKKQ